MHSNIILSKYLLKYNYADDKLKDIFWKMNPVGELR